MTCSGNDTNNSLDHPTLHSLSQDWLARSWAYMAARLLLLLSLLLPVLLLLLLPLLQLLIIFQEMAGHFTTAGPGRS